MTTGPAAAAPTADQPEPVYQGVEGWVTGQFLPVFRRPLGGEYRWCREWWQHAEAITRLTALWHAWEQLRLEPGTGMASWLRDHLDHQLPVLLGRGGPFAQCSEDEHIDPRTASAGPAPPGWWDPGDDTAPAPGQETAHDGTPGDENSPNPNPLLTPRQNDSAGGATEGGTHDDSR